MEIYLVRHTKPDVAKGICYGQADIDITETFYDEAAIIKQHVPEFISTIYCSPLQRCSKLAQHLYPRHTIQYHDELMEIDCGKWELQAWDNIDKAALQPWMDDLINVPIADGESYTDLYERVNRKFNQILQQELPAVIVAHGGVIRSILSYITSTPLIDSFNIFSLSYGCVIKLSKQEDGWQHQVLSNVPNEKETHKPTGF
ncbi:alpha-ribazole phosphatase [soil metagenome]